VTFTDGAPVNVRDAPGGARIASQPEGAGFTVLGGPYCADNYAWWWLELDDLMTAGYVAEGDSSGYFLEPWP